MQEHIHKALTRAINFSLKHDSITQEALADLAEKNLRVTLSDWRIDMNMLIDESGCIQVSAYDEKTNADASIDGTLSGFLSTAIQHGDSAAAREAGVTIQGDVGFAQALQGILTQLNIDWEGALATVVGGTLSRIIGEGVCGFMDFAKRVKEDLTDHTARYLKVETELLPSRQEVSQFLKDVTILRYDVDRLLAKFDASNKEKHHD